MNSINFLHIQRTGTLMLLLTLKQWARYRYPAHQLQLLKVSVNVYVDCHMKDIYLRLLCICSVKHRLIFQTMRQSSLFFLDIYAIVLPRAERERQASFSSELLDDDDKRATLPKASYTTFMTDSGIVMLEVSSENLYPIQFLNFCFNFILLGFRARIFSGTLYI